MLHNSDKTDVCIMQEVKDKQCTRLLERFAQVIREGLGIEMMETLQASEQAEADEHILQMEMVTVFNIC